MRKISKKEWTLAASSLGLFLLAIQSWFFGSLENWKKSDVNLKELQSDAVQIFPVAKADMPHTSDCQVLDIDLGISGCAGCDLSDLNCDVSSQMSAGC